MRAEACASRHWGGFRWWLELCHIRSISWTYEHVYACRKREDALYLNRSRCAGGYHRVAKKYRKTVKRRFQQDLIIHASQTPIPIPVSVALSFTSTHLSVSPGQLLRTADNVSYPPQPRMSRTQSFHTLCTQTHSQRLHHSHQHPCRRPCHSCRLVTGPRTRRIAPDPWIADAGSGIEAVESVVRRCSRMNVTLISELAAAPQSRGARLVAQARKRAWVQRADGSAVRRTASGLWFRKPHAHLADYRATACACARSNL